MGLLYAVAERARRPPPARRSSPPPSAGSRRLQKQSCHLSQIGHVARPLGERPDGNGQGRIPSMAAADVLDVSVVARNEDVRVRSGGLKQPAQEAIDPLESDHRSVHSVAVTRAIGRVVSEERHVVVQRDPCEDLARFFRRDLRKPVVAEMLSPPVVHDLAGDGGPRAQFLFVPCEQPGPTSSQRWSGQAPATLVSGPPLRVGVREGHAVASETGALQNARRLHEWAETYRNPGAEVASVELSGTLTRQQGGLTGAALRYAIHIECGVERKRDPPRPLDDRVRERRQLATQNFPEHGQVCPKERIALLVVGAYPDAVQKDEKEGGRGYSAGRRSTVTWT
jgi:hypothetical protein